MTCVKCCYPYASATLACGSCGWVPDPNYHPVLGAGPAKAAADILGMSEETRQRLYGGEAAAKFGAAKQYAAATRQPDPVAPPAPPSVVTATEAPAAAVKPDFSAPAVEETVAEPVDERIMPKEQPAPVADKPKGKPKGK